MFLCPLFATVSLLAQDTPRESVNFNFGWKFSFDTAVGKDGAQRICAADFNDADWQAVDLPHDFQINQEWTKNGRGQGFKEMSAGWYRKTFRAKPEWKGRRVLFDFEGIMLYGDAYLNGRKIGKTDYGYLGFEADVTEVLNYEGENVVAVYASTRGNSRWYTGGGLYRDVNITVKDSISVARNGMYITTPEISETAAKIAIQVELEGFSKRNDDLTVDVKIFSSDGKLAVKTETLATKGINLPLVETQLAALLQNPQLWSSETPNIYTAEISLMLNGKIIDRVKETFGIRKIEFSPEFGFRLNGKKVILKGMSKLIAVDNGDHNSDELFAGNRRRLNKGFAMAILRSADRRRRSKNQSRRPEPETRGKENENAIKTVCITIKGLNEYRV